MWKLLQNDTGSIEVYRKKNIGQENGSQSLSLGLEAQGYVEIRSA